MNIQIFDSLTHPTLNGKWLPQSSIQNNTIENLLLSMNQNKISFAFAVSMGKNIGEYHLENYIKYLQKMSSKLFPVAYLEPDLNLHDIEAHIIFLKQLGYIGIKIHPRLSQLCYQDELVSKAIQCAQINKMVIFICTYYANHSPLSPRNHLTALHELLCKWPKAYIILLHGGGSQLLHLTEIIQNFPNVMIDLSFTLCRYAGSSLDLDIEFLFKHYDKRICIGSDSPEYSQEQLRKRFEYFAKKTTYEKSMNVAHNNLIQFLTNARQVS